jgi:preprotein translocase subunit SecB
MAEEQQQPQPVFSIEKIYVKDLSLEVPNAPQVFLERDTPRVDVQLSTKATSIDEGHYEVVLSVTTTASLGEKTVFLVEAHQAAIFQIRNIPQENMDPVLSITCPNILFPYARETVSDAITRSGFPPFLLAPVNFEVLYQQRVQQQAGQEQATPTTH